MSNLPQNTSYNSPKDTPIVPRGFKAPQPYTPSTSYQNLSQIGQAGSVYNPTPTPTPGTLDDYQAKQAGIFQYGSLVNNGQGIPTETQFMPPTGDTHAPIPMPSDYYGQYVKPQTINKPDQGEYLSWSNPQTPVIRNLPGDVPGQYVQDTSNPDRLVKTVRGNNPIADMAMHAGRPGFAYQIDHIVPLELGGADTLANRELLTYEQNDQKTKAQAIPYTLYAHKQISLSEARAMSMSWKDRDLSDVPQPDNLGMIPIDIAQQTAKRWTEAPAPTFKDVMAGIPDAAKDFGKGWLPDPIREFGKGLVSGGTLGFVPYQQGENEDFFSKISGIAGNVVGALAPWSIAAKVLAAPMFIGRAALAAKSAFTSEKAAEALGATAESLAPKSITFDSLNKAPGYVKNFLSNPDTLKQAGKFAGTSAVIGQAQQFVANHLNPYVLSGQAPETEQKSMIGNILKDLSLGAITGVASPTLKGTAYSVVTPMALSFWMDPDHPVDALTNGVMFGVMHATGSFKRPGYNDVKSFGGTPYENPVTQAYNHAMDHAAYQSFSYYNPEMPKTDIGKPVPTLTPESIQAAKDNAIKTVWSQFFFKKNVSDATQAQTGKAFRDFSTNIDSTLDTKPVDSSLSLLGKLSPSMRRDFSAKNKENKTTFNDTFGEGYQNKNAVPDSMPELPKTGMDLQTALTEIKRITLSARQLYKGTLSQEMRGKADLDDLLSYGKMVKDKSTTNEALNNRFKTQIKFAEGTGDINDVPIAKQTVDNLSKISPDFMQTSSLRSTTPNTGKYPVGDVVPTGVAIGEVNMNNAKYVFEQKGQNHVSPYSLLVLRKDLGPLFSMQNRLLTPAQLKAGEYAIDSHPEYAIQHFVIVNNPANGGKVELVDMGMIASDHRLNKATAPGNVAFNQHPLVKSGKMRQLTPENHKDTIAAAMEKNGLDVLIANISPDATLETATTGQPYIPLTLNDDNWAKSIQLRDMAKDQPSVNPISVDIAKVNSAQGGRDLVDKIQQMKDNPSRIKPASEYIPRQVTPVDPKNNRISVPQETTRGLAQDLESALDVSTPKELQQAFKEKLDIVLPDAKAAEVFKNKDDMNIRDGVRLVAEAVDSGNASAATALKVNLSKVYLNSGALEVSPSGKAVAVMPLVGKRGTKLPQAQASEPVINAAPQQDAATAIHDPQTASFVDKIISIAKQDIPSNGGPLKDGLTPTQREYAPFTEPAENNGVNDSSYVAPQMEENVRRIENDAMGATTPKELAVAQADMRQWNPAYKPTGVDKRGKTTYEYSDKPIPAPKFVAREFYKSIDDGIADKENPKAHFFAKALDMGLKSLLGPNYRKDPALPKILADYFGNKMFFNEKNTSGRGIEMHKDIINAQNAGDWDAEKRAYQARKGQLDENATPDSTSSLSDRDLSEAGLEPGEAGFDGMSVRPWYQEDSMVHNMTRGEYQLAALFPDNGNNSAASVVRAVKKLFIGAGKDTQWTLKRFIEQNHPTAKKNASLPFDTLINDAKTIDAKDAIKTRSKLSAQKELPVLHKEYEQLLKLFQEHGDPENPAPNWATPEMLTNSMDSLMQKIKTLTDVAEGQHDGQGGPGIHDGKGGIGEMFGNLWNMAKRPVTGNVINYNAADYAPANQQVSPYAFQQPKTGPVTVYNAEASQTDATPNIGGYMRKMDFGDVAVANRDEYTDARNRFKQAGKDTFVKVPELSDIKTPYGQGLFRVNDTKNQRYDSSNGLDIFIPKEMRGGKEEKRIRQLWNKKVSYTKNTTDD